MSTLQTYNLKHPDASGDQITFTSGGDVNFDNGAVYLDSTNNQLGVGTTSPSSILHLQAANPVLTMRDSDTSGDNISSYILFEDSGGNDKAYIGRAGTSDLRIFGNGDTVFATGGIATSDESARIDSSGRLLAGMTSPLTDTTTALIQSNSQIIAPQGVSTANGGWSMLPTSRVTLTNASGGISGHTVQIDLAGINGANHSTLIRVSFAMRRSNSSSAFSQKSEYMGLWHVTKISTNEHIDQSHIVTREMTVVSANYASNVITFTFNTDNVRSFTSRAFEYCTTGALYTEA